MMSQGGDQFTTVLRIEGDASGAAAAARQARQEIAQTAEVAKAAQTKEQEARDALLTQRASTELGNRNAASQRAAADQAAMEARDAQLTRGASAYLGQRNEDSRARREAAAQEDQVRRDAIATREASDELARRNRLGTLGEIERTGQAAPRSRLRDFMDRAAQIGRTSVGSLFGQRGAAAQSEDAAGAADRLGGAAEQAKPKLGALAQAAGMLVPEFGAAISVTRMFEGALSALFTVPGAVFAAIGVSVGILVKAIKDAEQALKDVREENERVRQQGRERTTGVRREAARMGVGPEKVGRAQAIAKDMEGQGFERDVATRAAVLAADQGLKRDEYLGLASAMNQGVVSVDGTRERDRQRAVRKFRSKMGRPSVAEGIQAGVEDTAAIRKELLQSAIGGKEEDIAELLRGEGVSEENAKKRAAEISKGIKERGTKPVATYSIAGPGFGQQATVSEVNPKELPEEVRAWEQQVRSIDTGTSAATRPAAQAPPATVPQQAQAAPGPVASATYNYYGTVNQGKFDRFSNAPRMMGVA